jgi:ATP-binding cassette subfamily E protein 1
LKHFRGSELQNYFTKILEDNLKALIKPQYVDHIPRMVKGKVGELLEGKDGAGKKQEMLNVLDLNDVVDREISQLSGGELQRFAIAMSCVQKADMYVLSASLFLFALSYHLTFSFAILPIKLHVR